MSPNVYPSHAPLKAIYDVAAPAKLNLFLHVTGRRADGYHLIQSVFMLIDWCDTLHFELRRDGKITRSDLPGEDAASAPGAAEILPENDLTVRAARALQLASGTSLGVHINLQKNIPSQAGMGGGSSDAASCLLALQRLWGVRLPREKLLALALSLGADVPFFLSGGHAWVEGIGEKITPIELPSAQFVVVKPAEGLPTPAIFASPALKRDTETATIQGFAANAYGPVLEFGHNDLQPVAQNLCPQISQSIDWLSAQQLHGKMTGSGSTVFAHMPHDIVLAEAPREILGPSGKSEGKSGWRIKKCGNLGIHPLADW